MGYANAVYEVIHEADGWIGFDDIVDELSKDYSDPTLKTVREDLMGLRGENMVRKKDGELSYKIYK